MKIRKSYLSLINGILVFIIGCTFVPKISIDDIPEDISVDIKNNILGLCSNNPVNRGQSAFCLGEKKAVESIPFLIEILPDHTRLKWVDNYIDLPPFPEVEVYHCLEYIDKDTGIIDMNVFGLLGNNIYRESPSVSTSVSLEAQKALIKIGKPAVKPLISALNDDDFNIRQVSSLILLKMGELAVKPLISLLNSDNEHNSELAEMILINMLEISEPFLISALKNPDPVVRSQAAKILGKNAVKKPYVYFYYDFVSAGFFHEKHASKRYVSTIIKSLIDSLNDENKIVRISAKNSLELITKENFGMDYIRKFWNGLHKVAGMV